MGSARKNSSHIRVLGNKKPDLSRGAVWVQRGKAAGLGGERGGHCGPVAGRTR